MIDQKDIETIREALELLPNGLAYRKAYAALNRLAAAERPQPESSICKICEGNGWIIQHSTDSGAHDGNGSCLGSCPTQAQCQECNGTGYKQPEPSPTTRELVERMWSDASAWDPASQGWKLFIEKYSAKIESALQREREETEGRCAKEYYDKNIEWRHQARERIEELEEVANDIIRWSEAYPKKIFGEPTPEQVDELCKTLGCQLANISAMVLREFTKPWANKAKAILNKGATK